MAAGVLSLGAGVASWSVEDVEVVAVAISQVREPRRAVIGLGSKSLWSYLRHSPVDRIDVATALDLSSNQQTNRLRGVVLCVPPVENGLVCLRDRDPLPFGLVPWTALGRHGAPRARSCSVRRLAQRGTTPEAQAIDQISVSVE